MNERFLLTREARHSVLEISGFRNSRKEDIRARRRALRYAEGRASTLKELHDLEDKRGLTASLQRLQKTVHLKATGLLFKAQFGGLIAFPSIVVSEIDSIVAKDTRAFKAGS